MLVNIVIVQFFSDDIWVDFKTFGILTMTIVASLITGIYIYRYLPKKITALQLKMIYKIKNKCSSKLMKQRKNYDFY